MSTADTIKSLETIIAAVQAQIEQLKTPALTSEGWDNVRPNGTPALPATQARFALRHGCTWNAKEDRDLVSKWLQFTSVETLAQRHRRTEGSVRSELQRLLYTANVNVLLDEICGVAE